MKLGRLSWNLVSVGFRGLPGKGVLNFDFRFLIGAEGRESQIRDLKFQRGKLGLPEWVGRGAAESGDGGRI